MDKEVNFYHKEAGENEAIVQKMKDDGKDAYDMKQAQECLQEVIMSYLHLACFYFGKHHFSVIIDASQSYMMIPDSRNRFQKSLEDLLDFLGENAEDETIVGTEQLEQAKILLSSNEMPFEPDASGAAVDGAEEFADGEIF